MSHSAVSAGEARAASPATSDTSLPWFRHWVRQCVPTASVLTVLGSIALWGHSSEWTLPRFSSFVGGDSADEAKWCSDHNVLEAECIECRSDLVPLPKNRGWCKVHGIPQCPFEHPEVAQTKATAVVTAADVERAARALAVLPRPENRSICRLHERRIQFASIEAIDKAGIDISVVQPKPLIEAIEANGEIVYDATHSAELASRVAGSVWRVDKQQGDRVHAGEVLALIDSAAVGEAKTHLLQAIAQLRLRQANVQRLQPLADKVVAGRQFNEAVTAQEESRIQLLGAQQVLANLGFSAPIDELLSLDHDALAERVQSLGLSTDTVRALDSQVPTSNLFPLLSPIDGVVVERKLTHGEVVDTDAALFKLADVSRMWLILDVRQDDATYVSLGQKVLFRPSNAGGEPDIEGAIAWISTEADQETRTVQVRVNLPNAEGRLRANTFGAGRIVLREEPEAVMVANESIHWDGCCHVVFVRDKNFFQQDAPKFFHVRKVRIGARAGDTTEIIAGLMPGEVIASKNSVVLEAQLLKGNLGAGCCELDVPKKK